MGAVPGEGDAAIISEGQVSIVVHPPGWNGESQLLEEVVESLVPDGHADVPKGRNDIESGVFTNHVESVLPEVILHQTGGIGIDDANSASLGDALIIAGHLAGQLLALLDKIAEVPRAIFFEERHNPPDMDGSATLEDLRSEGSEAEFEDISVGRIFIHIE